MKKTIRGLVNIGYSKRSRVAFLRAEVEDLEKEGLLNLDIACINPYYGIYSLTQKGQELFELEEALRALSQ
jgi:DNA-binding HxlR family transcriptional regulator